MDLEVDDYVRLDTSRVVCGLSATCVTSLRTVIVVVRIPYMSLKEEGSRPAAGRDQS